MFLTLHFNGHKFFVNSHHIVKFNKVYDSEFIYIKSCLILITGQSIYCDETVEQILALIPERYNVMPPYDYPLTQG